MTDRDQVRRDLRAGLLPVREIARRAGCSVRTVYRISADLEGSAAERERTAPATAADDDRKALSAMIQALDGYYNTEV